METNFQHDFQGKVFLIVEDEESNYELLDALLSPTGAKLLHAPTGKMAFDFIRKEDHIDLVLMDIKLPDTSGYELTRKIRALNNQLPIIAQTAFVMTGDREKSIDAGCNAYISKPIDLVELLDLIAGFLN